MVDMGTAEAGRHWSVYGVSSQASIPYQPPRREGDGVKEHRGSFHRDNASRDSLPSIGYLDLDSAGKDPQRNLPKFPAMATGLSVSTAPHSSPTTASHPSHPPYSFGPSVSGPPPGSTYVSPTDPRRTGDEDKEQPSHNPPQHTPQRQSLPSIHEALGNDSLPYPPTSSPSKLGHPPVSASLPPKIVARPGADGPTGPPNPFSNGSTPYLRDNPFGAHQGVQGGQHPAEPPLSSLPSIHSQDSRTTSVPSLSSGKSPTQSSKTGAPSLTNSQSSGYEFTAPSSAGPMSSPTNYPPYSQQPVPFGSQAANGPSPLAYPPGPYEVRPDLGAPWSQNAIAASRMEDVQGTRITNGVGAPHSESVKRHLEGYDVESSYNEILEGSSRAVNFARHYATRAHQNNRSGPVVGSIPQLSEIDEIVHYMRRTNDALGRIRSLAVEQALAEQQAEQRAQTQVYKPNGMYNDEQVAMYPEEFKGGGGFAGGDAKKRRGKAAPPGRCHSCNRAETPEWRRGPDGARTLCNACGLHYAKLTRKMASNKPSSLGPNIRPKSGVDSRSPTHS
ncbi:hypothetical protein AJ79_00421 [Helicocarpus griseus UAMH5409]|uniref:GATA-type domain-containing protein n=1 Tax=Helicocarpus griseus UAMH5409 TaxID=1447875 RepID=A0A2B7YAS4_9EURO|nr:hypothetical protein AJ79_00421 [Helicocarpus griseus UAMH5409]